MARVITKKQMLIKSSDSNVDKKVRIQGTKFDRKCKIPQSTIEKMKWLKKCGLEDGEIATICSVKKHDVKYHTDPEWRAEWNRTRCGKHYGDHSYDEVSERANYKRKLLKANAHVVYPM